MGRCGFYGRPVPSDRAAPTSISALAAGRLNEIAGDQFCGAGFTGGTRAGITGEQTGLVGVARMEDDRHAQLHQQIGQRIDFAAGQMDIENRGIGPVLGNRERAFGQRRVRPLDKEPEILRNVRQVERDDEFVLHDKDARR